MPVDYKLVFVSVLKGSTLLQLLGFMLGWLTFYHQGHEVAKDFKPYLTDLQFRVQKVSRQYAFGVFIDITFGAYFQLTFRRKVTRWFDVRDFVC